MIPRVDVLGVQISAIDIPTAVREITRWLDVGERHYVCVTGVHGVMESQRDPDLMRIHNESGLTTPDGMPMVWAGRQAGASIARVYGPDLMLALLEVAEARGWSSFLYGGQAHIPVLLAQRLRNRFPRLRIAGTFAPPFRSLSDEEDAEIIQMINEAAPDIVWVGLSTPKQERWMASHIDRIGARVLIGVGAAFDIHAGTLAQAPRWMQSRGLEWLFRLSREPTRLWKRYLVNNPRFVYRILRCPPRLTYRR